MLRSVAVYERSAARNRDGAAAQPTDNATLISAWDEQLRRYSFSHWFTGTFRNHASEQRAEKSIQNFVGAVASAAQKPVAHAAVYTHSPAGQMHVHALIAGAEPLSPDRVRELWPHGITHCEPYDATRGAAAYLAQHIILADERAVGGFDISTPGQFVRAAGRSARRWYLLGHHTVARRVTRVMLGRLATLRGRAAP
jgi:hypothetical protein